MAQLVEQLIRNQQVAGSNPASSSKSQRTDKSLPLGFLSCLSVARNGAVRTLTRKRQVLPKAFRSRKGAVFGRKNKEPCKIAHILQGFYMTFPLIRQCFQKLENDLSLIFRDLRKQLEQRRLLCIEVTLVHPAIKFRLSYTKRKANTLY